MPDTKTFAACPGCGARWSSPRAFLDAADFELVGFTASPAQPSEGRVHFVHADDTCGAPFTLPVGLFQAWMGPAPGADPLFGTAGCPGLCEDTFCLDACDAACTQAAVREVLVILGAAADARLQATAAAHHE